MQLASQLRSALNAFLSPRRVRSEIMPGIPPGLDYSALVRGIEGHFGGPVRMISYARLSQHGASGTYRLFFELKNGNRGSLIYKSLDYRSLQNPALEELPVLPGSPEYSIYRHALDWLGKYLPEVYLSSETVPGRAYWFLLEDLGDEYRQAQTPSDRLRAVTEIPAIHRAMSAWSRLSGTRHLLVYDHEFSRALEIFAFRQLERLVRRTDDRVVAQFLHHWTKVAQIHAHDEFLDLQTVSPVHGNFDVHHVMINRKRPEKIKLVGWEWAGIGLPHLDLAGMLKNASSDLMKRALKIYSDLDNQLSLENHTRLYYFCQLERGMFEAAYLAAQSNYLPAASQQWYAGRIQSAVKRTLRAYRQLQAGGE